MLQFFRNIFKSKIGLAFTIAFIGLIGIAFAVSDVASSGTFGGVAGGDNVAVVGDEKIGSGEFSQAATTAVDRLRQEDPTLSMTAFIAQGGLADVLDQMIDQRALSWWANEHGLQAGDNLVNSEIRRIPAFAGPDGNFSDALYQQALAQQQLSDTTVRRELRDGLLAQQVLVPAAFGAKMPNKFALRYAALSKERRTGGIAVLPSSAFAPTAAPTQAQLTTFYNANRALFIRPERRVLRYAEFGAEALGDQTPSANEIAARYNRDKAEKYAGREERSFTQLIVPTKAAADAIAARGAGALENAAREAGLASSKIAATDRQSYAGTSSNAVAAAAFGAPRGSIAPTARGGLGYYVVRVDSVSQNPTRTLEQVRGEIAADLKREKTTQALSELATDVEQRIDEGSALSDIAASMKAQIETTPAITADGRVYGAGDQMVAQTLMPALDAAFEMEEGQPQITAIPNTDRFMVFETARITPSAAAPLAEIRDDVTSAWRRDAGSKAARAAADRVLARVGKGQTLAAALAAEKVSLPSIDRVDMTREELVRQGQRVPPPFALLFSMAKNSVKKLEAPADAGWYVVSVETVEPGKIQPNDPILAQARTSLGQLLGREYGDAMRAAVRKEAEVERNQTAIDAVRTQLTGGDAAQ
ncbi:SurA N-terminal domain-containing protein [Tsuneonella amylolytica]|uniref:SurA N-terminal domain-containing protein n=1 Tax=Tsuneonella amylolytica TaxID=2338327 RepID=UPI000EA9A37D|nr:SurA N-terminal domain-containing protein [Tsuneonella amylolytica]